MKNKILIIALICILGVGVYGCQDRSIATAPHYVVSAVNNTENPIYVEMYTSGREGVFVKSNIIDPYANDQFAGFVANSKVEDRYVFISNVDQTTILDTTVVTDPKMPYDGVNYTMTMTLNADKTLTIQTAPIVK